LSSGILSPIKKGKLETVEIEMAETEIETLKLKN